MSDIITRIYKNAAGTTLAIDTVSVAIHPLHPYPGSVAYSFPLSTDTFNEYRLKRTSTVTKPKRTLTVDSSVTDRVIDSISVIGNFHETQSDSGEVIAVTYTAENTNDIVVSFIGSNFLHIGDTA